MIRASTLGASADFFCGAGAVVAEGGELLVDRVPLGEQEFNRPLAKIFSLL